MRARFQGDGVEGISMNVDVSVCHWYRWGVLYVYYTSDIINHSSHLREISAAQNSVSCQMFKYCEPVLGNMGTEFDR